MPYAVCHAVCIYVAAADADGPLILPYTARTVRKYVNTKSQVQSVNVNYFILLCIFERGSPTVNGGTFNHSLFNAKC